MAASLSHTTLSNFGKVTLNKWVFNFTISTPVTWTILYDWPGSFTISVYLENGMPLTSPTWSALNLKTNVKVSMTMGL